MPDGSVSINTEGYDGVLVERFERSMSEIRWTESPSKQEFVSPDFVHLLQGRYSEHFVFETLQREHATEVLFRLALRRAF